MKLVLKQSVSPSLRVNDRLQLMANSVGLIFLIKYALLMPRLCRDKKICHSQVALDKNCAPRRAAAHPVSTIEHIEDQSNFEEHGLQVGGQGLPGHLPSLECYIHSCITEGHFDHVAPHPAMQYWRSRTFCWTLLTITLRKKGVHSSFKLPVSLLFCPRCNQILLFGR